MSRLTEKVVVITGAAQGIGKATAIKCGQEGAKVVLSDYDEVMLIQTEQELKKSGMNVKAMKCDVTKEEDIARLFKEAAEHYGKIDVLVNNAGIFMNNKAEDVKADDFDKMSRVNIKGTMMCIKHAIPFLKQQPGSNIVNLASISGLIGTATHNLYIMTKHAMVGITRSSAVELSEYGIRVNAVCPGLIETKMADQLIDGDGGTEEVRKQYESAYLLGRLGKAEEVANAIAFVASDEASFITGAMIPVDGGYTAI
ncbi:SDR family NAD(P)-dependent oxidoreductase [Bacillus chungangensis]|uniref:NAD(P)-dependent dehydrogenase (Short-subunit alcohol dehydrogenase family) n=1 Tax=Bacillus chungangensis TaxID=587633 RepID=A0ABT9WU17_9BACI|nr:SDR family oxidoreductase [Bacillus chungangensis]MDQ0176614.1 NAD(P)-dependent dehydrogenase (short-subunit alcohol dehydrogenase family) [Bacillus chungangensis]